MYFKKDRQIHLVAGITDMRKQINGLAQIANEKKSDRVFSGDYFVFLGKTRRVMKVLYWDHTGFCLWVKRLEEDSFPWTRKHKGVLTIERERFRLLLKGIDIFREHKEAGCRPLRRPPSCAHQHRRSLPAAHGIHRAPFA